MAAKRRKVVGRAHVPPPTVVFPDRKKEAERAACRRAEDAADLAAVEAAIDEEGEITSGDVDAAIEALRKGHFTPWAEVKAELGLCD